MLRKVMVNVGAVAAIVGMMGCAPVVRTHGYAPPDEEVQTIRIGQDTRGSVRRKIGRPGGSGIFTDEGWYYVSQRVEHLTYHAPEVVDRRIVAITFDQNDVVASVNQYSLDDGKLIDLETNTTPTFGRQLTILEQVLGNIGVVTGDVFEN